MTDIKELKEKELEKVTGGVTTENRAFGVTDVNPAIIAYTKDGVSLSITYFYGDLFDINENEYCWTSYENSSDGSSTTYYFKSKVGNNIYIKKVTASDNVIDFLYSALYFMPLLA